MPNKSERDEHDIVAKPLRHPGRWVAATLITVVLGAFLWSLLTVDSIDHDMIAKYLFSPLILNGAILTVILTAASMAIATVLATLLAVMKLSLIHI